MIVENPAALRFILQDDVYLLADDKNQPPQMPAQPLAEVPALHVAETTVEPVAKAPALPVTEMPVAVLNYSGKHKKAFLILTHYPEHEFIADEHLAALENILKRKDHTLDDVAILNMAKNTITGIEQLVTYFNLQKLLILGDKALPPMDPLTLNQPKNMNGYIAMYSFSFDEMMSSTENKKAFWDQMKNL
ncbi:MAG TPA: hypothetical protein VL490_01925 [Mucilaginibacter sp.]|nr:hypothetical protein [Mucilaginibacter sp.]